MKQTNLLILEIDQLLAEVAHCVMLGLDPSCNSVLHHATSMSHADDILSRTEVDAALCKSNSGMGEIMKSRGIPVVELPEEVYSAESATLGEITAAMHSIICQVTSTHREKI